MRKQVAKKKVAIVYNEPVVPSRYDTTGEKKAVLGVLDAVEAVYQALVELGYTVTRLPLALPIEQAVKKLRALKVDLVFNLFEGFPGFPETEVLIPETLTAMGLPFTGCRSNIIRLCLDKSRVKEILKIRAIPTPDSQLLTPETLNTFRLEFPCIVKPFGEDASHGVTGDSVVSDPASLERQVKLISGSYGGKALVEKFVDGREFNVTVLGKSQYTVFPISEIVFSLPEGMPKILTFAAKWEENTPYYDGTKAICPADITAEEEQRIKDTALSVFRMLGCSGYARVDMRQDQRTGEINVIEVNPNPDISPGVGAVRQSAAAGMTYAQFIARIIEIALEKEPVAESGQTIPDAPTPLLLIV